MTIDSKKLGGEPGDKVFLIHIFSEKFFADIWATATTSQRLSKVFWKSTTVDKKPLPLPSYTQDFEFVFAKEEFDVLSEHYQWDYVIELLSCLEPKSFKMYPFSSME